MYEQERKYSVLGFGYNDVVKMEPPRPDTNEILSQDVFRFLCRFVRVVLKVFVTKSANRR
jgi:hypothetical protein